MTTSSDPRHILDESPMTALQIAIVVLTVLLNAMDGYDVLVIAVSANGIAEEWGIDRAALGFVLTAELFGMAVGSLLFGGAADKHGRRTTLLICLGLMAGGMLATTTATNPYLLCLWRVVTGLGIGGTLACTNAVVAEFSNRRNRGLCISLMVIGYPLGGTAVSLLGEQVLVGGSWRTLFYVGGGIAAALLPFVYFLLPESVPWLTRTQPHNALQRVNQALAKLGHRTVAALPRIDAPEQKVSVFEIFSPALIRTTFLVLAAYALHMATFYFLLKWVPVIVTDFGFNPALASGVLTWTNIGSAFGGFTFGLLSTRIGLKPLSIAILFLSSVAIVAFGRAPADLATLKLLAATAGFFTNGAISGLYAIVAMAFPTQLRATGTGFVIGVGRGGAVISPVIAGYLFAWEFPLPSVALAMASGSLLAALALCFIRLDRSANAATGTASARASTGKPASQG